MRRNKIFGKVADFISRLTQPASQKRVDHAVYLHYHRKAKLLARAVA